MKHFISKVCPITGGVPTTMDKEYFDKMCKFHQNQKYKNGSQKGEVIRFHCAEVCRGKVLPEELKIKKISKLIKERKETIKAIGECEVVTAKQKMIEANFEICEDILKKTVDVLGLKKIDVNDIPSLVGKLVKERDEAMSILEDLNSTLSDDRPFEFVVNEARLDGQYASLTFVLNEAFQQASGGKGKERHANDGEPFEEQKICTITRSVGLGYPLGQAMKKTEESLRLGVRGLPELLGAINYLCAGYIVMKEGFDGERLDILDRYEENDPQQDNKAA